MSTALPFQSTPEAAKQLRRQLRQSQPGREPALICQLGFEVRTRSGKLTEQFQGEHFGIVYYNIGERPQALHIELFGHDVSIVPDTLERLRGRTLTIRREVVGHGRFRKKKRDLLVAV